MDLLAILFFVALLAAVTVSVAFFARIGIFAPVTATADATANPATNEPSDVTQVTTSTGPAGSNWYIYLIVGIAAFIFLVVAFVVVYRRRGSDEGSPIVDDSRTALVNAQNYEKGQPLLDQRRIPDPRTAPTGPSNLPKRAVVTNLGLELVNTLRGAKAVAEGDVTKVVQLRELALLNAIAKGDSKAGDRDYDWVRRVLDDLDKADEKLQTAKKGSKASKDAMSKMAKTLKEIESVMNAAIKKDSKAVERQDLGFLSKIFKAVGEEPGKTNRRWFGRK